MTTAELERSTITAAELKTTATMKALVYHGPGKYAWEDKPRPAIKDPGDAIVRITTSTICGTDLHILKGDLPAVTDGPFWATRVSVVLSSRSAPEFLNFMLETKS
jgi:hypothetical protein